jgi:hypothetical protein
MPISIEGKQLIPANFLLPLVYLLVIVGIGLILHKHYQGTWILEDSQLTNCDAGWYRNIMANGYQFRSGETNNTAFFPLFPYVWRWLGLSAIGISIVNAVIFVISSGLLFSYFPSDLKAKLAWLALSITAFYVTPFSESFFLFFSFLVLLGLSRKKAWPLLIIGIIGAGLTRSVVTIFFPAFLIIGVLKIIEHKRLKEALPYFGYSLLSLATLFIVFFIHWFQTGVFWAFSLTQKYWGSQFRMPVTPFATWDPQDNGYYDQFALFVGLISIIYLGYLFTRVVIKRQKRTVDDATLFSIIYFAGVALLMLFTRGGEFNSINRYIFATSFLFLFIRHLASQKISLTMLVSLIVIGAAYYLICWHMGTTLERAGVAAGQLLLAFSLVWAIRKNHSRANIWFLILFSALAFVQAGLWYRYVMNIWVG